MLATPIARSTSSTAESLTKHPLHSRLRTSGRLPASVAPVLRPLQDAGGLEFEIRKYRRDVLYVHVFDENFREDIPEVRGEREIAAFVELLVCEAGPSAINF